MIEMFVIFRLTYPIFFILLFNQSVLQRHSAAFHSGSSSMKMSITYKRNEYSCNTHTNIDQVYTCLPIENQQTVSIRCVPIEHMCNGIRDCPNGDDESETNCGPKFPEPILNDASNIQGAVTYYALMATLCTVMIILILVAFFVHRFRKLRCDSAFRGVNFAPLIYRPVGTTVAIGHTSGGPNNYPTHRSNFGSASSLMSGYPVGVNRESRSHSHCCIANNYGNNIAVDRAFNNSLQQSSSRFFVNYNVHNSCMRIVQPSRAGCSSAPTTPIAPPSYLETVLDPSYHRRSTRMPSVPDESEIDAPPYEESQDNENQSGSSSNSRAESNPAQNSPPPPYSET